MKLEDVIQKAHLISIDSRTIAKGQIFLAIKGKAYDGHDFAEEALKKGAAAVVIERKLKDRLSGFGGRVIIVKDTLRALGDIAKAHRRKFKVSVVGVTGSNGKTTAKDMIAHVLSARYSVLKNETSKNNLIGLPLTLLKLNEIHDVAVLEMGMNRMGEIGRLSEIAEPHIGVVTNIGPSHLELLGTLKNVLIAKSELLSHLSKQDLAILNRDDVYLRNIKGLGCRKIYFGIKRKCHFHVQKMSYEKNRWSFSIGTKEVFEVPLLGKHNVYNALIAIAVGNQFGIDFSTIAQRIESYKQSCPMRLELKTIRGVELLDDSYNSNPLSLESAIDTLLQYNADGKKIVVTGDMLELGKKAKAMHEAAGELIASNNIQALITLGDLSKFTFAKAKRMGMRNITCASSHQDAAKALKKIAKPGDVVLVKGSRAMEMEKIIKAFK